MDIMPQHNRRTFLKVSGAALGGLATGTTVTAAISRDRYIAKTNGNVDLGAVDVIHELQGIDFAVVRAAESDVREHNGVKDYAPDIELELDDPDANAEAPTIDETGAADEPYYDYQWDKQALDVPTAHETTKGEGTRVAIIDTGVAAEHPDLDVNEEMSRNFTDDDLGAANAAGGYHGTHVGGIVAAQATNEVGAAGTAPATDLVDCRVFSGEGGASFGDILAAMVYSASIGADAANLSLGAYPVPRNAYRDDNGDVVTGHGDFYGKVLNSAMTYVNREGTLLVIAAGNDAADLQHDKNLISLPNEGAQAVSVSATGPVGFKWGDEGLDEEPQSPAIYTNYGTNAITLGAPGGDYDPEAAEAGEPEGWANDMVFNTISQPVFDDAGNYLGDVHSYGWLAGTSMAAPQVAGAAALVKSANPEYNANQVESALTKAADVPDDYGKEFYGAGFLNILDAL